MNAPVCDVGYTGGMSTHGGDPNTYSDEEIAARVAAMRDPTEPARERRRLRGAFADVAAETEGVTFTKAAALAGLPERVSIESLLSDPAVCKRIIKKLQPRLARFERLTMRAWDALDFNLDPANWEPIYSERGKPTFAVTGADRVASAALVFKVLAVVDPNILAMRAQQADAKAALRDLVRGILSESTRTQEGDSAPAGPPAEQPPALADDDLAAPPDAPEPGDDAVAP